MKTEQNKPATGAQRAFTLIELLVVIAVIAVLAGMVFGISGSLKKARIKARARAELAGVILAIDSYKAKLGYYPPDNRLQDGVPWVNQLYYELRGTTNDGQYFMTADAGSKLSTNEIGKLFGINGIVNCDRGRGDELQPAEDFLKGLKADRFLLVSNTYAKVAYYVLGSMVEGPRWIEGGAGGHINPIRYNSSSPTNNPGTFDLWIDVKVGSQTNRICNWSDKPLIVGDNR